LRGVERKQAHQMKRVGVIGLRRKRLLATKLSVEILLGSQVAEAGLIERGRRIRRRLQDRPGAFSSRPAFATVHQCI
jgi:hypothetical protein